MSIINWLVNVCNKFSSKRICTKEAFMSACAKASEQASKDADGYINVKEATKIIVKSIFAGRLS